MIPVPTYQLIPFLDWLHRRGVRLSSQRENFEELRELALQFLRHAGDRGFTNLAGLMVIFQDCPMIREPDVETQMDHFAGCGSCIKMIEERKPRPHFLEERRLVPWEEDEERLHPLLRGFVEWAQGSELESRLRVRGRPHPRKWDHSPRAFRDVIHDVGHVFRDHFRQYLSEIREHDPGLIEDYETWRRHAEEHHRRGIPRRPRSDERTQPLGSNESLDQAAQRLADSVRLAIDSGFYDDLIAEEPRLARFLSLVMESPENLAQALEFINWLRQREPELKLPGNIPAIEFEGMALQFCEERGYSNGKSFSREAQRWLTGAGSERIIDRIARFLGLDRRYRSAKGQPAPRNPLDRYGSVRFHAMFLFLSSGDFPRFIEANWRDLHHLTGDDLDIYFSQKDLSERTSGYEIVKELRSLQLRVDALPAMLLWENQLETSGTIPLHGLDHGQIVDVVKTVVQAIRDGCSLSDVVQHGAMHVLELQRTIDRGIVVQSGAALLINNGGVMRDVYKNEGVVGAIGPNAVARDNVFLQDARKILSEITLTSKDAAVITQLAEALASRQVEGLELTERIEGARHLAALADAAKEGRPQEESLAGWKRWISSLGGRAQNVLAVLANVATIANPIAKLLGLPL